MPPPQNINWREVPTLDQAQPAQACRKHGLVTSVVSSPRKLRRHPPLTYNAHLKRILKLDRLRLRGPKGAKDEFLLAATAQNLRKMARLIPMGVPALAG